MVQHVFERASGCGKLDELVVATDSHEIRDVCAGLRIPVCLTSASHASGTDRVFEVLTNSKADIVVNIQGDEPLLAPAHIDAMLNPFEEEPSVMVSTLRVPITAEEASNPNNVKVLCNAQGFALYFSRWPIPYDRSGQSSVCHYKHLGFYAYRRDALELFHSLPASPLEQAEVLEQLRFLEHGVPIRVADAPYPTIGVDTEEDLRTVERILQRAAAA